MVFIPEPAPAIENPHWDLKNKQINKKKQQQKKNKKKKKNTEMPI